MSNLDVMKKLYDAFDNDDVATIMGSLDREVEWIEPDVDEFPYQGLTIGRDAVAEDVLGGIPTIYRTLDFRGEKRWVEAGDAVVVLGTGVATGLHGNSENFRFVHVWTLRNGVVVRFDGYADTHKLRKAITGE
jgi:ketosteroid isomerase-like protein